MKSGIEGLSRLEDAKGDLDEFAHHGADDDHGYLAGGGEAIPKDAAPSGFVQGDHGGPVPGLAPASMARFREAGLAPHAAARLMLARVEAGEGRRWAGVVESVRTATEDRDGVLPQAGDGSEPATLGFEVGIVVDPLADRRLDRGDDAIQMRDQRVGRVAMKVPTFIVRDDVPTT
jgi:hypothetical protein